MPKDNMTAINPAEFPSPGKQRAMGELLFLAMRSGDYARIPLGRFRDLIEPAIDHKQVQVFRFDDVPRGAVLWAKLSADAEERFLNGEALSHEDWNSGNRCWVAGLLAPYQGLVSFIVRWGKSEGNLPSTKFNYLRLGEAPGEIRKVVSIDLGAPKGQRMATMSVEDYRTPPRRGRKKSA